MANSAFRPTVDRCLVNAGQQPTPDDTNFDNNTIDKIALQAKYFVDMAHSIAISSLRPRFLRRQYSIGPTAAYNGSNNSYAFPTATTPERMQLDREGVATMFNQTTGNGPLTYLRYEDWQEQFPGGETISSEPTAWFLLPPDGSGTDHVGFSAPPDKAYTFTFQGYAKPTKLTNHGDLLQFPPEWEQTLWVVAAPFIESALAEGKAPDYEKYTQMLLSRLKANTLGPPQESPYLDLGISVRGMQYGSRRYQNGGY